VLSWQHPILYAGGGSMTDLHRDNQEVVTPRRYIPVYAQIALTLWMLGIVFAYWLLNDRLIVPLVGIFREMAVRLVQLFS
jgi:hypothetical protein